MESQIKAAQVAAKTKSNFLSKMSHEIRTPLNAIIGMLHIAQNTSDPNKTHDCMMKMEFSAKHLLGIINDILDFSKIESGALVFEKQWISLTREVTFIASMFKDKVAEKRLDLQLNIGDIHNDCIQADKLRLNQVLINLLSNAVKFTDAGGKITLVAEELFHADGESAYRFVVQDTGVGIEPEEAKKLFTPFTQANAAVTRLYGGTGLGLVISQSLVRMMGGDIELDTQPGAGSAFQFTIRVPAKEKMEEVSKVAPLVPPVAFWNKRILIVDDIAINREILVELLQGGGITTETAVNGKEALEAFCRAGPYWYDLILMDMQMPVMDGCAAAMEIRASGKADARSVKIVAMTANVMQEDVERTKEAGMDGHLAKPVDLDKLYALMREYL